MGDKTYSGYRRPGEGDTGGEGAVTVHEGGRSPRPLDPRLDLRRHSPGGFNWGYAGSGPAQLALALAADALGDDGRAREVYQRLKARVVAELPADGWTLTAREVLDAVRAIEQEREAGPAGEGVPAPGPDGAATPFTRRVGRHLAALAAHGPADGTEAEAVMRERGWMEAVRHLAARGGLSHAGRVEAGKLLAASEDWLREQRGGPGEGAGR